MIHFQKKNPAIIIIALVIVCAVSPLSIPIPQVPITLQTFILFLMTGILGKRKGTLITVLYLICGAIGFPVFSDFSSGLQKFTGSTAGFIWAFPVMCYVLGWLLEKQPKRYIPYISSFVVVHLLLLVIGFTVLMIITGSTHLSIKSIVYLIPGLLTKSIIGGGLSLWISNRLAENAVSMRKENKKQREAV